jgi:hypothetical protein
VESRSRGWGLQQVEKIVKHEGKTYTYVTQIKYPCSRLECLGEIEVEWYGTNLGKECHAHLYKQHKLTGENAAKYEAGHTDKHGVWHATPAPPPVVVEPAKRKGRVAKTPEPEPTIAEPTKRKPRAAPAAPRKGTKAPRKGAAKPKAVTKAAKTPRQAKAAKPTKRPKA